MSLFPRNFGNPFSMTPRMDDLFHDMDRMERRMRRYYDEADNTLFTGNMVNEVTDNDSKFGVELDVSQFRPEELAVNLEDRMLTIEGKQEKKYPNGYTQRSFIRKWTLPEDVDVSAVQSSLTDQGHLILDAPKKGHSAGRTIPIMPAQQQQQQLKQ